MPRNMKGPTVSFQPPKAAELRSVQNPLDLPRLEGDPPAPWVEVVTPTTDQPDVPEIDFHVSKFSFYNDEDEDADGDMHLIGVYLQCTECDDWEYRLDTADSLTEVLQSALDHQARMHRG